MKNRLFVLMTGFMLCVIPLFAAESVLDSLIFKLADYHNAVNGSVPAVLDSLWASGHALPIEHKLIPMIQKNQLSQDGMRYAINLLAVNGSKDILPVLKKTMKEPETFDVSLYGLERHSSTEAVNILRKHCTEGDEKHRIGVIHALGRKKSPEALKELHKMIRKDKNLQLKLAAMQAAGMIASPKSISVLQKVKVSGLIERERQDALLLCLKAQAQGEEKKNGLQRLMASDFPPIRIAAFRALADNKEDGLGVVRQAMQSEDSLLVSEAIAWLKSEKLSDWAWLSEIQFNAAQKVQLLGILSDLGRRDTLPLIKTWTHDEDVEVRIAALKALTSTGDVSVVTLLIEKSILKNKEGKTAAEVLNRLSGKEVNEAISAFFQSPEMDEQVAAIRASGLRYDEDARLKMKPFITDEKDALRLAACEAMACIGTVDELPNLLESYLKAKRKKELQTTRKTVSAIVRRNPDAKIAEKFILPAIGKQDNGRQVNELLLLLGEIGDPGGYNMLVEATQSDDGNKRMAAIEALTQWPDEKPFETLFAIGKDKKGESEGIVAIRGCIQKIHKSENWAGAVKVEKYQALLDLNPDAATLRMILSRAAQNGVVETWMLIQPYLEDERVQSEAELALLSAVAPVWWRSREMAEPILKKLSESKDAHIRSEANKVLMRMNQ